MAKPILVANWKNYPNSLSEAESLLKDLAKKRLLYQKLSLVIAPPYPYLALVATKAKSFAKLGAQNFYNGEKETVTGEVGSEILKGMGVRVVVLGHSERRALGETAEVIKTKIRVALDSGFAPLLCFGELVRDVDGDYTEVIRKDLKACLATLSEAEVKRLVLAYEPVWSVGKNATGVVTNVELKETILFIRKVLSDMFGRALGEKVPVLYGGSVDEVTAPELYQGTGISGFLVGRASLTPKKFEAIAQSLIKK